MNVPFNRPPQLPMTPEEVLALPPMKPRPALPSVLLMGGLWGLTAWALHAAIFPAKPTVVAAAPAQPGLTMNNAVELTDEIVTALAADQFSSVLLKVQLAQKVAQQLHALPPAAPASP